MTQDAATLAQLRRMVNEPTTTPYTDTVLTAYIESHPAMDTTGLESGDTDWVPVYDLHWAAADIWEEKAAAVQAYYNFSADGGNYSQDQLYQTAMEMVRYHQARRKAGSRDTHKSPVEVETDAELTYDGDVFAWRAN
jgi:hypothetical protein